MSDKELNSVIDRAEDEYQKLKDKVIEQSSEIERLKKREQECIEHYLVQCKYASEMEGKYIAVNNIINELKEWFKGYHKSYASCKWYEEDYIEFIEHLENELKGSEKE